MAPLPPCGPLPEPDPGWELRDEGPFSFRLPREYRKQEVHGIDSFVGEYAASGRNFLFDYGMYSSSLTEWDAARQFHACRDSITGHQVKIVTAHEADGRYVAGVVWRELEPGLHLTIHARARTAAQQQEALAAMRTVRFNPPRRER
ncbi:MAG TPA: hypothetical protein VF665_13650 [Longimicrobium sp.]|uniref:hypothetical protein n=1 Tax=Longimicrobium sp. TaxID=2029185 RepID=UPI002EDB1CAA